MIVQGIAVAAMLLSFPARSALLAMGHQRQVLNVAMVSIFAFHCAALALIPLIGAMGANIAHILLGFVRSEEHTSELQSLMRISYAVFCLKKQTINYTTYSHPLISNYNQSKSHLTLLFTIFPT